NLLCRNCGWGSLGDNDIDLESDELSSDFAVAFVASLRPANLDCDGSVLDPAKLAHALHKGGDPSALCRRYGAAHEPDGRELCRLLRDAPRAATRLPHYRAWLKIFVARCSLPCDPSGWGSFMQWRMITTLQSRGLCLLQARPERPRRSRAAEQRNELAPSDSDRHVALPSEGCLVKGTISHRKRAVFTRSQAAECRCAARPQCCRRRQQNRLR